MKKLYAIVLTKKLGQIEIVPMSLSCDDEIVKENCASMSVMFPGNEYFVCELCPVKMEAAVEEAA